MTNGDIATLKTNYYWDNIDKGVDECFSVQFTGKLFYDTYLREVLIEPDVSTIVEV